MEKAIMQRAVAMSPPLKMVAVRPLTPRSLSAFPVQLNHGAVLIAKRMRENPTSGVTMPKRPRRLTRSTFTILSTAEHVFSFVGIKRED
jgi:hypothetical protein